MKTRIIKKGECWENSPLASIFCLICGSKSLSIEIEILEVDGKSEIMCKAECSCGAIFECSNVIPIPKK